MCIIYIYMYRERERERERERCMYMHIYIYIYIYTYIHRSWIDHTWQDCRSRLLGGVPHAELSSGPRRRT